MPSSTQLASLGVLEKNKEQEREPSVLALSIPSITSWFPLLPVTTPAQKLPSLINASQQKDKVKGVEILLSNFIEYTSRSFILRRILIALFHFRI